MNVKKHNDKSLLKIAMVIFCAALFSVLAIDKMPQLIVIFALSFSAVRFILKHVDSKIRSVMVALFLITFFIQLAVSLFIYNQTLDTKYRGFSFKGDDYVYGDFGTIVGGLWRRGIFPNLKNLEKYNLVGTNISPQAYQFYNAFIFYLFGLCGGRILLIINCFLHVAIIIPVYFICKGLNIRNGVIAFGLLLFLFWPSIFCWSCYNFKEPMLIFCIFAIFALLMETREKPSPGAIIFLIALNSAAYLLKQYLIIIFVATILYFFIFVKWRGKAVVLIAILSLIALTQFLRCPYIFNVIHILETIPQNTFNIRHVSALYAYSGYFGNLLTFTYARSALYLPFGIFATFFLPFLIRPFNISQVASNIESIFWWCLLPFLLSGIWIAMRKELKKTFPMLFVFIAWVVILAITQGNMGTLLRQKALLYYTGFIFIILAIDRAIG